MAEKARTAICDVNVTHHEVTAEMSRRIFEEATAQKSVEFLFAFAAHTPRILSRKQRGSYPQSGSPCFGFLAGIVYSGSAISVFDPICGETQPKSVHHQRGKCGRGGGEDTQTSPYTWSTAFMHLGRLSGPARHPGRRLRRLS